MCSLVVGSVSCSACVNRRCLGWTIWAAALRTASSCRCAAASTGLSVCLARCRCRACVTAPLMVASLTRGSLKSCSVAWCAWLSAGQPSCCRRVSAGVQPTSVSLPVWSGHFLKCCQSSGVMWSHGQRVCSSGTWMCLQGDLEFLLELLDVCPAVRVAEHAGEMLDGVGVMVCSVVGGMGGVLWYPVRGLMGLRFGGYVLEVCVVPA